MINIFITMVIATEGSMGAAPLPVDAVPLKLTLIQTSSTEKLNYIKEADQRGIVQNKPGIDYYISLPKEKIDNPVIFADHYLQFVVENMSDSDIKLVSLGHETEQKPPFVYFKSEATLDGKLFRLFDERSLRISTFRSDKIPTDDEVNDPKRISLTLKPRGRLSVPFYPFDQSVIRDRIEAGTYKISLEACVFRVGEPTPIKLSAKSIELVVTKKHVSDAKQYFGEYEMEIQRRILRATNKRDQ